MGWFTFYYCSFLCHKELICNDRIIWGFKVVYHLHGLTGRLPWFGQMVSEIHNWSILPRIAFTLFTNHGSIYWKNDCKGLKVVSKMALKKWNTNSIRENRSNRTTFFRCSVTQGNFSPERPKKSCFIYFLTGLSGKCLWMVNNPSDMT